MITKTVFVFFFPGAMAIFRQSYGYVCKLAHRGPLWLFLASPATMSKSGRATMVWKLDWEE